MKVWEEYARRHKERVLKRAEEVYEVWRKFAESGNCEMLPIGCENCPFNDKNGLCGGGDDDDTRIHLNSEV